MKRRLATVPLLFLACSLTAAASENGVSFVYQPLDSLGESGIEVCRIPFVTGGAYPEVFYQAITMPHRPQQSTPQKVEDLNAASQAGVSITAQLDGEEGGSSGSGGRQRLVIEFDFAKAHSDRLTEELIQALLQCVKKTGANSILHSKIIAGENYPQFVKMIETAIPPNGSAAIAQMNPVQGLPTRDAIIRDLAIITNQGEADEARIAATQRLSKAKEGYARLKAAIHEKESVFEYPGLLSLGRVVFNEGESSYSITLGVPPLPNEGPEQGPSPSEYQVVFFGEKIQSVKPLIYKQ